MYLDYDDRLSYFYAIKVRLHIQARLYGMYKQLFTSGKFKVYPYKNVVAFYKHALAQEGCREESQTRCGE